MIILSIHFDQYRIEVSAYFSENYPESQDMLIIEHSTTVLSHKDQVRMNVENTVPASSNLG